MVLPFVYMSTISDKISRVIQQMYKMLFARCVLEICSIKLKVMVGRTWRRRRLWRRYRLLPLLPVNQVSNPWTNGLVMENVSVKLNWFKSICVGWLNGWIPGWRVPSIVVKMIADWRVPSMVTVCIFYAIGCYKWIYAPKPEGFILITGLLSHTISKC